MTLKRVVLADDHTLLRAGVCKLLESVEGIEIVGEAANGVELLALVDQLRPDLVITDITMPELNGLDATLQIMKQWPATRVIVLTMYEDEEYVSLALGNGALGYLLKDAAPAELENAINAVFEGRVFLSPRVSQFVIGAFVQQLRSDKVPSAVLSARQKEVLQLVTQGHSTKDIARQLNLSTKTIETHRSRLMQQLDIHEITGLVRYAIREGLIAPG